MRRGVAPAGGGAGEPGHTGGMTGTAIRTHFLARAASLVDYARLDVQERDAGATLMTLRPQAGAAVGVELYLVSLPASDDYVGTVRFADSYRDRAELGNDLDEDLRVIDSYI